VPVSNKYEFLKPVNATFDFQCYFYVNYLFLKRFFVVVKIRCAVRPRHKKKGKKELMKYFI